MRDRTKVVRLTAREAREIARTARIAGIGGSALMRRAPALYDALDALVLYAEREETPDPAVLDDARAALGRPEEDE